MKKLIKLIKAIIEKITSYPFYKKIYKVDTRKIKEAINRAYNKELSMSSVATTKTKILIPREPINKKI